MSKSRFMMMFVFIAIGAMMLFVQPALAAQPPQVTIDVNPDVNDFDISSPNAIHVYTVPDGGSINDTLSVQVCMTDYTREEDWSSIAISFGATGGNLSGVFLPADQTFLSSWTFPPDDCRNLEIPVVAGPFNYADGDNYIATFNMSEGTKDPASGNNAPNASFVDVKNFKIQVDVLQPEVSNVSCFLTDSEGMFLTDCEGEWVTDSGSDGGRFAIVVNKKKHIQAATNPGQFYFNFLWYNSTGNDQTVDVDFERVGVIAKGANAIHSAVFSGDLYTVNPPDFDETNMNGIPDGSDDLAQDIFVPAGSSLLVTYHLEWADKGQEVPGDIALDCDSADQEIWVIGTVFGDGITEESCGSGALGYEK